MLFRLRSAMQCVACIRAVDSFKHMKLRSKKTAVHAVFLVDQASETGSLAT